MTEDENDIPEADEEEAEEETMACEECGEDPCACKAEESEDDAEEADDAEEE